MKFINEIKKFWEENTINNKVSGMKFKKFTNNNIESTIKNYFNDDSNILTFMIEDPISSDYILEINNWNNDYEYSISSIQISKI